MGLTHYYTGKPCYNGHITRRQASDRSCTLCNKKKSKRHLHGKDPIARIFDYAQRRAKKSGIDFTITIESLMPVPNTCPCCNRPFTSAVSSTMAQPSLDRVNNNHGYTPANTRIICADCNNIKSNLTIDGIHERITNLKQIAAYMADHFERTPPHG